MVQLDRTSPCGGEGSPFKSGRGQIKQESRNMKNEEIAGLFLEIKRLLELKGENQFKIRSYDRAANTIVSLAEDIKRVAERGELLNIPGIGKGISGKITEYVKTGKINYLEELRKEIPAGIVQMLKIPGLGPKKIRIIREKLHIESMRGLEIAARRGDLAGLPGFGEKTERNIMRGIEMMTRMTGRFLLPTAEETANDIIAWLMKNEKCSRALPCGSYRRGNDTIGDIDIIAVSDEPQALIDEFTKRDDVEKVFASGKTKGSVFLKNNVQADLRVIDKKSWGAACMYFTGSKQHNIHLREFALKKVFTLNEYGLYKNIKNRKSKDAAVEYAAGKTEEEVYKKLGLDFIPPELREDRGEIEAAQKGNLPRLIEIEDIKGDLHVHSSYSDGSAKISEIAEAAVKMGYSWIAVCDHSRSLKIADGLSVENLMKKRKEIEKLNRSSKIRVLFGAEVDILSDGALDYPDEVLKELDVCIAAVHSAFKQPAEEMNRRILKAMDNPHVDILAHPTCRLIGKREPLPVDIERIIKKAREKNIILEVNAFPDRLDLNDISCRRAVEEGVMLSLGSDTHALRQLSNVKYGIKTMRRGWVEKGNVINTMTAEEMLKKFGARGRK